MGDSEERFGENVFERAEMSFSPLLSTEGRFLVL
jgi:hypothetical protein